MRGARILAALGFLGIELNKEGNARSRARPWNWIAREELNSDHARNTALRWIGRR